MLAILAGQNQQLGSLARDSDAVLEPLARERQHITGFIANANVAAEATAERARRPRGAASSGFPESCASCARR